MKLTENELEVGKEYWFDKFKVGYGTFVKSEKGVAFFKPINDGGYSEIDGLIGFDFCGYLYFEKL